MSTETRVDNIKVTISQAARLVNKLCRVGLVPMIHGSPALGKSAVAKMVAKKNNLVLIDLRLSQCEPTDLLGLPAINQAIKRSGYMPMDTFPLEGDELPPMLDETGNLQYYTDKDDKQQVLRYNGWLLFLDEFNSAERQTQAAAYKVILDRMIGMYHMHPMVFPLCAGNLDTDGAIVEPMSTAMQSRLCHLEVMADADEWCQWAITEGVDHRLVNFIEYMPKHIYSFKPDHSDRTYSSPRTLEFANKWLSTFDINDDDSRVALSGILGHGVASELITFCHHFADIPKIAEILANPEGARVPTEEQRGQLFAVCGAISHHAKPDNVGTLIKYVRRFPKDMQVVAGRMFMARDQMLLQQTDVIVWYSSIASYLFPKRGR